MIFDKYLYIYVANSPIKIQNIVITLEKFPSAPFQCIHLPPAPILLPKPPLF